MTVQTMNPSRCVPAESMSACGSWIGPNVELGAEVSVAPGAVLGYACSSDDAPATRIGQGTRIGPNVCIEPGVTVGPECVIEAGCILRSGSSLARGARLGPRCTLMGACRVDEFVHCWAEVHVCEHAELQPHCQVMPGAILMNEPYPPTGLAKLGPSVGRCAVVGARAILWPGVKLGYHAMAAAMSEVKHDVDDYVLVRGQPAKPICDVRRIRTKVGQEWVFPYPWMRHFSENEDVTRLAGRPSR